MRVAVVGGGAAGLVAAAEAARRSADVVLLEKNGKTGVKILMSGGTRCNLTHDTDAKGIVRAFGRGGRFLQSSVGAFPPTDVVRMFHRLGVPTKVESTGKIFPSSDRAVHVRDALERDALDAGVEIRRRCGVRSIALGGASDVGGRGGEVGFGAGDGRDSDSGSNRGSTWRIATDGGTVTADRLIITAGGQSWPGCGTTGDAYAWLRELGHTIVSPRPALVPLVGGRAWMRALSGVTVPDVVATVRSVAEPGRKSKRLIERRGGWLFTHFGFSGPVPMDVSGTITAFDSPDRVRLSVDFAPDLADDAIGRALADRSRDGGRASVVNVVGRWFPQRLGESIVEAAGAGGTIAELAAVARRRLVDQIKRMPVEVSGTRGFEKAEVTAGGVDVREVDPRTMTSRLVPGLYIAGEVLDVDGWIGGYNFQAAFSTGRAAGIAAAMS